MDIWIKAYVNLLELPLNSREVVENLNQDIDKYEDFRKKDFNLSMISKRYEKKVEKSII